MLKVHNKDGVGTRSTHFWGNFQLLNNYINIFQGLCTYIIIQEYLRLRKINLAFWAGA